MTTTTPRLKTKRTQPNSPSEDSPSVCPVCLDPIVDATVEKEGQEGLIYAFNAKASVTLGFTDNVQAYHKLGISFMNKVMIHFIAHTAS